MSDGMLWYYVSAGHERLSAEAGELPTLVASGVLRAQSLVWHPGQPEWMAAGEVMPELFAAQGAGEGQPAALARLAMEPLLAHRGWLFPVAFGLAVLVGMEGRAVLALLQSDPLLAAGALSRNFLLLLVAAFLLGWWWRLRRGARSGQWEDLRSAARTGGRLMAVLGVLAVFYLLSALYRGLAVTAQRLTDI